MFLGGLRPIPFKTPMPDALRGKILTDKVYDISILKMLTAEKIQVHAVSSLTEMTNY